MWKSRYEWKGFFEVIYVRVNMKRSCGNLEILLWTNRVTKLKKQVWRDIQIHLVLFNNCSGLTNTRSGGKYGFFRGHSLSGSVGTRVSCLHRVILPKAIESSWILRTCSYGVFPKCFCCCFQSVKVVFKFCIPKQKCTVSTSQVISWHHLKTTKASWNQRFLQKLNW